MYVSEQNASIVPPYSFLLTESCSHMRCSFYDLLTFSSMLCEIDVSRSRFIRFLTCI